MPLPAALLSRLQKRGIVHQQQSEQVEEVFAESYDDKEAEKETSEVRNEEEENAVKLVYEIADCPNTTNRYHECTEFCKETFGLRSFAHRLEDEGKRLRLLRKYPLPAGWAEVGDPSTGRCYYWNEDSDKVSWLPPQHPRAKITVSAEKLQSNLSNVSAGKTDGGGGLKTLDRRKPVSVSIREPPSKKKKAERMEELDPMDPASYSEVERGTWSTGLKADTKTGVDSTASGPLFQQRPYPSPGDVLRAQAAAQRE